MSRRRQRKGFHWLDAPAVAAALLGTWSPPVCAQSPDNIRKLSAEALFDQGLRLMKSGDNGAACPKLAESQRLDPGIGTLLYLADCYRSLGKTASAWVTFREAAFQARKSGQVERETTATHHAEALRKSLTLLSLQFETVPAGVNLDLDGHPVSPELIGLPFPLDPGRHTLDVSAPGLVPWSTTINVEPVPGVQRVRVPALAPRRIRPARPAPILSPSRSPWTGVGWVALGTGLGALAGALVSYTANREDSFGPIVLGSAGALCAGTGVIVLTHSTTDSHAPEAPDTALHAPLLGYRDVF